MGNLGFWELAFVAVIALVVFGPERLPDLARQAGKFIARLRQETSRSVRELKQAADVGDLGRELKGISRDLRDVRASVGRSLQGDGSSSSSPSRSEDRPPPTDPEAT